MLIPSRGPSVACGNCKSCGTKFHRNYEVEFTPTDAEETRIFMEIFELTRPYCSDRCVPGDVQKKVKAIYGEAHDRCEEFKAKRRSSSIL